MSLLEFKGFKSEFKGFKLNVIKNRKGSIKTYFIDCKCRSGIFQELKIKKVNQRKIKFSCKRCHTAKTVIVPKGFSLCKQCHGTGTYKVEYCLPHSCDQCHEGLIAWSEVTK